jgi:hypothetical protein
VAVALHIPSATECKAAIPAHRQHESRGPVYFRALERINAGWGDATAMADGTGLLLKSWHNVFYRFGPFDPARLTGCIEANMEVLSSLCERTIDSLSPEDEPIVRRLFNDFTDAPPSECHSPRKAPATKSTKVSDFGFE